MVVGVPRRRLRRAPASVAIRIECSADRPAGKPCMMATTLIARPTEIEQCATSCRGHSRNPVDLLPAVFTDVPDPQFASSAGTEREAKWIAQAIRDDALRIRLRVAGQRIARSASAAVRIDADDAAVDPDIVAVAVVDALDLEALGAQRAALVGGLIVRIAWVQRGALVLILEIARLAEIAESEARPVAAAGVEIAVRPELDRPDRVTRKLLIPVLNQHLLVADRVAGDREFRHAAADHAAAVVGRVTRRIRAVIGAVVDPARRIVRGTGRPARKRAAQSEPAVVRILHIHVGRFRKARVERESE